MKSISDLEKIHFFLHVIFGIAVTLKCIFEFNLSVAHDVMLHNHKSV